MMVPADYAKSDSKKPRRTTSIAPSRIGRKTRTTSRQRRATRGCSRTRLAKAIPSQVTKANELRNALKPPTGYTPTPQKCMRRSRRRTCGEREQRSRQRGEGPALRRHLKRQGQQRTNAYVGHQGASASAASELATNRKQQRDPNSGYVKAKVVERGKAPVDPMQKHADDLIKLADKLDADAAKQKDQTVAQQMRDEAARTRMRVNEIKKAAPKQSSRSAALPGRSQEREGHTDRRTTGRCGQRTGSG
jgi:hypothetical protein